MQKCKYCGIEKENYIAQHETFCTKNPNHREHFGGKKYTGKIKEVIKETAKTLEKIDTKKESGIITQKQHDVSSQKAIEQAITPETKTEPEEQPKGEKNPLYLLFIVILVIVAALIIFMRDEILQRIFPKDE